MRKLFSDEVENFRGKYNDVLTSLHVLRIIVFKHSYQNQQKVKNRIHKHMYMVWVKKWTENQILNNKYKLHSIFMLIYGYVLVDRTAIVN